MKTKTSCCSSSAACTLLPMCNISHFCRTSTSPLHFHLCTSRQQGKQQWAFYFDLSFGFPHDLSHDCSQTDISPHDSPPYRNQGASFHPKTEDTSSSTWPSEFSLLFYHGYIWEINRNQRKRIHPCFRKKNAIRQELFCTLPSFAWKLQMKSSMDKMCGHIVVQGAGECSQVW